MARYRRIPTTVRSERDLARALAEMGLKNVEVHARPEQLRDWIGRPTDVLAEVVVRRKDLGATADDLGFARSPNGTFDLLASDIHLFRFDRKFVAELARRTGTTIPPPEPVQFATMPAAPKTHVPPPVSPGADAAASRRWHAETTDLMERAKRAQKLGAFGCLAFFLPVLPWFLLEQNERTATGPRGLLVLMFFWGILYLVALTVVFTLRLRLLGREFQRRFPAREARAAALAHLRDVAEDKQNKAADVAKRFLKEVEREGTSALKQLQPKARREPGAKGR